MNQEQFLNTVTELAPMILSVIGAMLGLIVSSFAALLRYGWKLHNKRMAMMTSALEQLAKAVGKYEETNHKDHSKLWDAILGLRAELQLSTQKSDHIKAGLHQLEGALGMQVSRVDTYVERMGRVDAKLDRIFSFIDAPKRATDG